MQFKTGNVLHSSQGRLISRSRQEFDLTSHNAISVHNFYRLLDIAVFSLLNNLKYTVTSTSCKTPAHSQRISMLCINFHVNTADLKPQGVHFIASHHNHSIDNQQNFNRAPGQRYWVCKSKNLVTNAQVGFKTKC